MFLALAVTLWMVISERPHVWRFEMSVLTPAGGVCCVWFIIVPCVGDGIRRLGPALGPTE
jgi:hypothetical protein